MKKFKLNPIVFHIFMILLMISQLLCLFFMLSMTSIGNDDMCQLEVSISDSLPRILELLLETDNNPPLFTLLAALWVRIAPYGSGWLKLLSQIFLVAATGVMGYYSKHIFGTIAGIVTAVFSATSTILIYCSANVFRPYGLLFLTGALACCAYLHRRHSEDSLVSQVLFGIAITAMAYTHYFGILTCLALFLYDVFLFIKKRTKWYSILPYLGAGLCYLPWLVPVVSVKLSSAGSFWPNVPTLVNIYTNCYSKYFDSTINIVIFLIFAVILTLRYRKARKTELKVKLVTKPFLSLPLHSEYEHFTFEDFFLCLWVPFFVTIIDLIYSGLINPAGSMWVERYFIVLYPFSFLLIGISWSYLSELMLDLWEYSWKQLLIYLVLVGFLALQGYQFVNTCLYMSQTNTQPFQQAVEYLDSQDDFYDETTGFLPTFNHQKKAYRYFFTRHNQVQPGNINWLPFPLDDTVSLEDLDTLYLLVISNELDEQTKTLIEENFVQTNENTSLGITKWERMAE